MRNRSGAGASVSSGASFQARVGAFLVAGLISKVGNTLIGDMQVQHLSFETVESVDDINVVCKNGVTLYIQAKSNISYSLGEKGELYSVIEQFVNQKHNDKDHLILATTNRASNKVVVDLRSALEAFRTSPVKEFFRDQPIALQNIIKQITSVAQEIFLIKRDPKTDEDVYEIIKRMRVVALDIEEDNSLEQAVILNLAAKGCIAANVLWGKIISDCVVYSKDRRTLSEESLFDKYGRYFSSKDEVKNDLVKGFFSIEERGDGFRAGRDVFLCDLLPQENITSGKLTLIETYRFNNDCQERVKFTDSHVEFSNGINANLYLRASTYSGITRLMGSFPELIGESEIVIIPIHSNNDHDFDSDDCAKLHAEKLMQAWKANPSPLNCVICGKFVSTGNAQIVELEPLDNPVVGCCHKICLSPSCRVIGQIESNFFSSYEELVNFDIEKWYSSIDGGQMAFSNAKFLGRKSNVTIVWSGYSPKGPVGNHVVEVDLVNGDTEIITTRNEVQKFTLEEAEQFSDSLNQKFECARLEEDPFCYTDLSKGFGSKSMLLSIFGADEIITPVKNARPRRFNLRDASKYSRPGYWYAPLCFLKSLNSGDIFSVEGTKFLLSDPLKLKAYLKNWEDVGLIAEDYEVSIISTDQEFDEFMRWNVDAEQNVVVDPLFDLSGTLLSGYKIHPIEMFKS